MDLASPGIGSEFLESAPFQLDLEDEVSAIPSFLPPYASLAAAQADLAQAWIAIDVSSTFAPHAEVGQTDSAGDANLQPASPLKLQQISGSLIAPPLSAPANDDLVTSSKEHSPVPLPPRTSAAAAPATPPLETFEMVVPQISGTDRKGEASLAPDSGPEARIELPVHETRPTKTAITGSTPALPAPALAPVASPTIARPLDISPDMTIGAEIGILDGRAEVGRPGGDATGNALHHTATTSIGSTRSTEVIAQIGSRLTEAGSRELTIRLDPPELGSVRIVLSGTDGNLTAAVVADRADVEQLLRRHANDLEAALSDAGYGSVNLDFGGSSPHQDDAPDPGTMEQTETHVPIINVTVETAVGPTSGLDIRL